RLSKTEVPRSMEALFVFGIALQFVSESLKLFEQFTYWDKIDHPTLVALTAWLSAWLLLGYRDAFRKRLPVHLIAAVGLLLGIAVGATWEYVEFASDWFGDADLQKSNADTMTDLISNDVGAFVALQFSLRLYGYLRRDECTQAGELARWLSQGVGRVVDRHGRVIGAAAALLLGVLLLGGAAIDRGWPPLAEGMQPGETLAWRGLDQAGASAVVAGDWVPDAERGICRVNLEDPKPGSEKPGLLQLAPGRVYGARAPFRFEARVYEQRPDRSDGTQMDGGLAFGIRDANDYYLLEQSALHDILRLDRVVHNHRRDVKERLVRTHGNEWHTLHVRLDGGLVWAGVDGQDVFAVPGVPDMAGGIGLWARTASATCFDTAQAAVPE
ncbi:MAG TPA: hypothetical protein VGL99_18595, partial [Chloroflexota bacterium]